MVELTFSASTDSLRGIKPRVSSFGADQFDEADMEEVPRKYVFFNWFIFAINMGAILGITVLVYVREKKGWALGFGLPTGPMVTVASMRNHFNGKVFYQNPPCMGISTIALSISFAKLSTFFISRATIMDRKLSSNSTFQQLLSPFSAPSSSSPSTRKQQCRSFHLVGQLKFFYDKATDGTRSDNSAVFLSEIGIGIWLSTAIVKIIESPAGGEDKVWQRNSLNKSRLDYFYRELTVINAVDFAVYLWTSAVYKGRGGAAGTVRDEGVVDMGDDHGASMEKDED
ncbi:OLIGOPEPTIDE TRANSPORTER-RELATED [Salix purpurea]|uniref:OLIGOPEPTIDE TRANSPORTER-RELATED n=1 Tax=Salix purpurea TaxID=77065 RepID=A0A9Q0PAP8_SALPP|nr:OLIGOPEPTIDE TRANSPORTER-RELATED [Salix purpurea]